MSKVFNRRTFLSATTSLLGGGVLAKAMSSAFAVEAEPIPGGIIDTHTHFYDPARPQGVPWPPKNDPVLYQTTLPERFRRVASGLGVTGTVVVEASPWPDDNQWLLDLAAKDTVIVGIVGNLEAGTPQFKDHLARFTKNPLYLGIRINARALAEGLDRPEFVGDLKRIAEAGREVDFVGGPAMLGDIARLAAKIPDLRIVIDHFPFDVAEKDREAARGALRTLGRLRQVFAKVSNVLRRVGDHVPEDLAFYKPALDELWDAFGPDRLIYGSNWPVSDRVAPYPLVHKIVAEYFAGKGREALENYFRKNSLAAYHWAERTSQPQAASRK